MSKVNSSFRVRIYELPLNRFANVALPQFLGQLQQHESNLNKHIKDKDWDKVRTEQLKGQQVASQLQAALRELEGVGCQLKPEDEKEFENKIRPYRIQALIAVKKFKQNLNENFDSHVSESEQKQQLMLSQEQILPEEIEVEQRKIQLETYEDLQKDIEELHDLFSEFAQQVHTQGSTVSNIESNVDDALENVKEGQQNLAKAAKFKATMYPVTGALIGTCIGGPVGFLAGLKIGGLAALGGSLLGFASGRGLKKWQESVVNEPAENLTTSQSTPVNLGNTSGSKTVPHSISFGGSHKKETMAIDSKRDDCDRDRLHFKNL
ncbi:syntaxin-17-like [Daphnia pulicaria]|uniref:syntaxin-17-like n=1 Tax=Daphnia pulicaria TaxID=35523 RepID=UPI001EE9CB00|nr:syntaxin-17-like [Daphnia pulicaria]